MRCRRPARLFQVEPEPGRLDPRRVRTNFVVFKVDRDRAAFLAGLEARDVLMVEFPYGQIRAVTHYGIGSDEIDAAVDAVEAALAETAVASPVAVRA